MLKLIVSTNVKNEKKQIQYRCEISHVENFGLEGRIAYHSEPMQLVSINFAKQLGTYLLSVSKR